MELTKQHLGITLRRTPGTDELGNHDREILQTYPYLSDHLEFLSLVVKDEVAGPNRDPIPQTVSEAAFALLYFQTATDLIPDPIPGMGLLDDAMIVGLVLRRHEDAFKRSSHAYKLHWPLPTFDIDQLLSVVSPLRLDSFYSSSKSESICNGGPARARRIKRPETIPRGRIARD